VRNILFYRTRTGKCPVEDFLDSLEAKEAQKATWVLKLIEELPRVPSRYFKKLVDTGDIWEVRIALGRKIFRILGFWDGSESIVLTNAFQKKTQKTPQQVIRIAEARKRDYFQRRRKTK